MPQAFPVVVRTLEPSLITKEDAKSMICRAVYDQIMDRLKTDRVSISVRGVIKIHNGYSVQTNFTHLPRESRPVSDFCPTIHDLFEVRVEYSDDHLQHSHKMTRAEFVIELLEIWDAMLEEVPKRDMEITGKRLIEASETLRSTYKVRELANLDYLEIT